MSDTSNVYEAVYQDIRFKLESRTECIPIQHGTGYTHAIAEILSESPDKSYAILIHASYRVYWQEVLKDSENVDLISIRQFTEHIRESPDKEWDMIIVDSSPRMTYGLNSLVRKSLLNHTDYLCELKTTEQIMKENGRK